MHEARGSRGCRRTRPTAAAGAKESAIIRHVIVRICSSKFFRIKSSFLGNSSISFLSFGEVSLKVGLVISLFTVLHYFKVYMGLRDSLQLKALC